MRTCPNGFEPERPRNKQVTVASQHVTLILSLDSVIRIFRRVDSLSPPRAYQAASVRISPAPVSGVYVSTLGFIRSTTNFPPCWAALNVPSPCATPSNSVCLRLHQRRCRMIPILPCSEHRSFVDFVSCWRGLIPKLSCP